MVNTDHTRPCNVSFENLVVHQGSKPWVMLFISPSSVCSVMQIKNMQFTNDQSPITYTVNVMRFSIWLPTDFLFLH